MTGSYRLRRLAVASLIVLGAYAGGGAGAQTTPPTAPAEVIVPPKWSMGQALWNTVNGQCVPEQQKFGNAYPCAEVSLTTGYAVLKDRRGKFQFLLMPTLKITGIEDPQLLAPNAVNYFDWAWRVQNWPEDRLKAPLAREDASVAVNSVFGRSQGLLHLHVECVRTDVRDLIKAQLANIGPQWSAPITIDGHPFRAMWIDSEDNVPVNPFTALAQGLNVPASEMGAWTLVLVGATSPAGQPGFVLLAARAQTDGKGRLAGYSASGEELQDHRCVGRVKYAGQ